MAIPLYFLLIVYLAFLTVWLATAFVSLYHILKYGFKNFTTFFATILFLVIAAIILFFSYDFISAIDWQERIVIFGGASGSNLLY